MRHFLNRYSLGILVGYLVSGAVAHFLLTRLREQPQHPPAWTAEDMLAALGERYGAEVFALFPPRKGDWPIPHLQAGCFCGRHLCVGRPLPEEELYTGIRIRICSICAQNVVSEP